MSHGVARSPLCRGHRGHPWPDHLRWGQWALGRTQWLVGKVPSGGTLNRAKPRRDWVHVVPVGRWALMSENVSPAEDGKRGSWGPPDGLSGRYRIGGGTRGPGGAWAGRLGVPLAGVLAPLHTQVPGFPDPLEGGRIM